MFTPRRAGFARPERAGRRREIGAAVAGVGPRPGAVPKREEDKGSFFMVFFDQRDLRAHEKAVHKSEFHCVYCDKQFRKAAYLEKHMVQHKMLTENHTAPGLSSTNKEQEKLLAATPSVKKTFRCKVCIKSFKKKSSWKKHSKLHL